MPGPAPGAGAAPRIPSAQTKLIDDVLLGRIWGVLRAADLEGGQLVVMAGVARIQAIGQAGLLFGVRKDELLAAWTCAATLLAGGEQQAGEDRRARMPCRQVRGLWSIEWDFADKDSGITRRGWLPLFSPDLGQSDFAGVYPVAYKQLQLEKIPIPIVPAEHAQRLKRKRGQDDEVVDKRHDDEVELLQDKIRSDIYLDLLQQELALPTIDPVRVRAAGDRLGAALKDWQSKVMRMAGRGRAGGGVQAGNGVGNGEQEGAGDEQQAD